MEDGKMEAATVEQAGQELGVDLDPGPQDVYDGDILLDEDMTIDGSGQLSFGVTGKQPTTSSLRLTGGKVSVGGQFDKGERVVLRVEAIVGEVAFIDQVDGKTGQVVGCERRQKARIVGVHPAR